MSSCTGNATTDCIQISFLRHCLIPKGRSTALVSTTILTPMKQRQGSSMCISSDKSTLTGFFEQLAVPKYPPLWTKPPASLADPEEVIPVNEFCATSLLDYEGELVFITSRACKDIKASEADDYILGYTIGNDLSCRFFQMPDKSGGQFFFAKAFDKFAPMGPMLVGAKSYNETNAGRRLRTRVNGKVVQDVAIDEDMIFTPAQVLSHMSQGKSYRPRSEMKCPGPTLAEADDSG